MELNVKRPKHHSTIPVRAKKFSREQQEARGMVCSKGVTESIKRGEARREADYLRRCRDAFYVVNEAKKRSDQSFLHRIAAFAKSESNLSDFFSEQGRGRKFTKNDSLLDLLRRVKFKPDGNIKDIKTATRIDDEKSAKQRHTELVRFCKHFVRDLESNPSDPMTVAREHGLADNLGFFIKARLIGMHYSSTKPEPLGFDKPADCKERRKIYRRPH